MVPGLVALAAWASACGEPPPAPPELSFWNGTTRVNAVGEGDPAIVRFTGADPGAAVTLRARVRRYAGWCSLPGGCARDGGREPRSAGGRDLRGRRFRRARSGSLRAEPTTSGATGAAGQTETAQGPLDLEVRAEVAGVEVARAVLTRHGYERGLDRRDVRHDGLVGVLFTPDRTVARPAVLVLGGSEGGLALSSRRAAHLAARGYAALALAVPGTQQALDPGRDPREYFETALAWLARHPEVPDRLRSRSPAGASIGLLLGATFPALRVVVVDVPSPVRSGRHRLDAEGHLDPRRRPPALPGVRRGGRWARRRRRRCCPTAASATAWPGASSRPSPTRPPRPWRPPLLRIERTERPILLIGAGDDGVWPSCLFVDAARAKLRASGHADCHPDAAVCFADAGHLIGPPARPPPTSTPYRSRGWAPSSTAASPAPTPGPSGSASGKCSPSWNPPCAERPRPSDVAHRAAATRRLAQDVVLLHAGDAPRPARRPDRPSRTSRRSNRVGAPPPRRSGGPSRR